MIQQNSYLDTLFQKVAKRVNKSVQQLQQFKKILLDNWYDTQESILNISEKISSQLKIPLRLIDAIKTQIKQSKSINNNVQFIQINNQTSQYQKNKKKPLTQDKMLRMAITLQQELLKQCNHIGTEVLRIVNILKKIIANIIQDSCQLKYRTLKKSNKTIYSTFCQHKSCMRFIKDVGFQEVEQTLYLHAPEPPQLFFIQQCLNQIIDKLQSHKNMTVQQQMNNNKKIKMPQVDLSKNFTNDQMDRMNYAEGLQKLIAYRQKLMSQVPKNRKLRIYHQKYDQKIVQVQKFDLTQQIQKTDDQVIAQYWRNFMKSNHSNSAFQSKRKLQFQFLLKQKIHKQTCIKIFLPNQFIIQAWFAPMQTLNKVFTFVSQIVDGSIYLYTSPPVKKMNTQLTLNLQTLQCVPNGKFYLGSYQQNWKINNKFIQYIEK